MRIPNPAKATMSVRYQHEHRCYISKVPDLILPVLSTLQALMPIWLGYVIFWRGWGSSVECIWTVEEHNLSLIASLSIDEKT